MRLALARVLDQADVVHDRSRMRQFALSSYVGENKEFARQYLAGELELIRTGLFWRSSRPSLALDPSLQERLPGVSGYSSMA